MTRHSLLRTLFLVILASVVALTAVSCGSSSPGPDDIAIEWWNAFSGPDRDKLAQLTCQSMRPDLEMAMNNLAVWTDVMPQALGGLLGIGDIEVGATASDLKAKVLDEEQTSARVEVKGVMRMGAMGISATRDFNYPMVLIMEDGKWVVCDAIVTAIVNQLTGIDQLGLGVPQPVTGHQGQVVVPGATLSVEQAVQATLDADKAVTALQTQQASLALTPTATPTPTPLSESERQKAIVAALARATLVAQIDSGSVVLPPVDNGIHSRDEFTISRKSHYAAESYGNGKVFVWDFSSGQLLYTIETGYRSGGGIALSPDGQVLATAIGSTVLWNTVDGQMIRQLDKEPHRVIVFSPEGRTLAIGGEMVELWNTDTGSQIWESSPLGWDRFSDIEFSPSGELLAVSSSNKVYILSSTDGTLIRTLDEPVRADDAAVQFGPGGYRMVFNSDGRFLATSSTCGQLNLWNLENWELVLTIPEAGCYTGLNHPAIAISPDGRHVLTTESKDGYSLRLFEASTGNQIATWDGTSSRKYVSNVVYSPGGNVVAVSGLGSESVTLFSVSDWQVVARLGSSNPTEVIFTDDGKYLVTAFPFEVWQVDTLLDSLQQ